jgi:hypothetical protein
MNEDAKPERERSPRWDSYPLPGAYAIPRWNAGIRYWPGAVLLGCVPLVFVTLTIAFGFNNGPLLAATVLVTYPLLLILAPARKRLVPREVRASTSPVPIRLWVLGWLLISLGVGSYNLTFQAELASRNELVAFLVYVIWYALISSGALFVVNAPAWEQWRHRARRNRGKSPDGGSVSRAE